MSDVSYRRATHEDFPEISSLLRTAVDDLLKRRGFFETSPFASSRLPPAQPQGFPWFELGLKEDSEGFWVAVANGELAGITLSWVRGSLWYLAHLFVSPDHQGLNIGQGLLDRALQHGKDSPITNRALVTFAYNPVSISLYARYGMYAREPLYFMECPRQQVNLDNVQTKVKVEKVENFRASGVRLTQIDQRCVGYPREKNHEFLNSLPTVQCYLFSKEGEPVGYSYVWKSGRVGPLASVSSEVFPYVAKASLGLAAEQEAQSVGVMVAGSNEELVKIALAQKMRIVDNFLLMSSKPLPNLSNYVLYPTGAML